jgi:hypothetical protein
MKTRKDTRSAEPQPPAAEPPEALGDDDADLIRYSLTALGEAVLSERRGRFRGFGPCVAVA